MTEKPPLQSNETPNPFLMTGSHIGTLFKTGDMRRYIFKRRKDRLLVLNVENIEERLKIAGQFLARYPAERVVIVARRLYGQTPAQKFAELTGCRVVTGRFIPGMFSNPMHKKFSEPKVILVTEPEADLQAIKEAAIMRIPVVALASTNNSLRDIDLVVPINNKGRKSLALAFWTMARMFLIQKEVIKTENDFVPQVEDFEYKLGPQGDEDPLRQAIMEGRQMRRKRGQKPSEGFGRRPREGEGRSSGRPPRGRS